MILINRIVFSLVTFFFLTPLPTRGQQKTLLPRKLVFEVTHKLDSTGIKSLESFFNSFLGNFFDASSKEFKEASKSLILDYISGKHKWDSLETISIENVNDTIYKYDYINNKIEENYEQIEYDGRAYRYHKKGNVTSIDTIDYTKIKGTHILSYDKSEEKTIQGYSCYKATIVEKHLYKEDFIIPMGDFVHEMYITPSIKVPLHAISLFSKDFPGFPLEIKSWNKKLPGVFIIYSIKEILW